jgi:hypothetical protein
MIGHLFLRAGLASAGLVLLAACASPASPTSTLAPGDLRPTTTPPPTATTAVTPAPGLVAGGFEGLPLSTSTNDLFSASGACSSCHTHNIDESGNDVSTDSNWRASIKAQAARDPYFLASVRAEVEEFPEQRTMIESTCATCHAPMADYSAGVDGQAGILLDDGFLDSENPLHELALDGVSCTLCHQIRSGNLGPSASSGGYLIDTSTPRGEREAFGPFGVDEAQAQLMQNVSGFVPVQSTHVTQSELCATCHTLYTRVLDSSGSVVGEFPEQVPYLEWYYSDYRNAQTCRACHMPAADGGVKTATSSLNLRSPFAQHTFYGGNAYMLTMLKSVGEEVGLTASAAQLEAAQAGTLQLLQGETASIAVENVIDGGTRLSADVRVENLSGHKFPTAFPSRRAWIHFTITDAAGGIVFESGAVGPDGTISGNDNDADGTQYEIHYETVNRADQVQIYEAILRTADGRVTTSLHSAAGYLKDNRLLPAGFEKAAPYPDIMVRGAAMEDEDFLGGGDVVTYLVPLGSGSGPYTVTAELLFQTIGFRWADNLHRAEGAEIDRFFEYYAAVPNAPVVIASASQQTP